jgi:site-specific recombinase XerD
MANPFKEVKQLRGEKRIPRGLLKETEMEMLLEGISHFDEQDHLKAAITLYKVHVVAELMYATGLRVSEVASLRLEDIDFSRSMTRVQEAKGGHQRIAFLGEFAREVLRLYVERLRVLVSSEWNLRNSELLFGVRWESFGHILNRTLARACLSLELTRFRGHVDPLRRSMSHATNQACVCAGVAPADSRPGASRQNPCQPGTGV